MPKLKKVVRILYVGSSLILTGVALSALIGLLADFSHMMNACVTPDNISEEVVEIIMMSIVCMFFGSSVLREVWSDD